MVKKKERNNDSQTIDVVPPVVSPTALQRQETPPDVRMSIITPLVTPEDAKRAWKTYEDLCKAILSPQDFTKISGYQKGKGTIVKLHKNKSAWRKLSTAFNLSTEVIKEERKNYETYFTVQMTVRTTAPNGRYVDGTGACASNERNFAHTEHDVRAMAETRAKNRSISDMIGGGEVSAEELIEIEEKQKNQCPRDHEALPQKQVSTDGKNKGRPYVKCPSCTHFKWLDEEGKDG